MSNQSPHLEHSTHVDTIIVRTTLSNGRDNRSMAHRGVNGAHSIVPSLQASRDVLSQDTVAVRRLVETLEEGKILGVDRGRCPKVVSWHSLNRNMSIIYGSLRGFCTCVQDSTHVCPLMIPFLSTC